MTRFFISFLAAGVNAVMAANSAQAQTPGDLFMADISSSAITDYTPAGTSSTYANVQQNNGLAFGPGLSLFVTDGTTIVRVPPGPGTPTTFATGIDEAQALVRDPATGNLYSSGFVSGAIDQITPKGVVSTYASGFDFPVGMAIDSNGNLYVANEGAHTISEITPQGAVSTFASGLDEPQDLAFNGAGDLFVSNYGDRTNGSIDEFTPGGVKSTFATGIAGPYGLAFNSTGVLFVIVSGTGTIEEFTPAGLESTFASYANDPHFMTFAPLPEPSTWALLGLGGAGMLGLMLQRRRTHQA